MRKDLRAEPQLYGGEPCFILKDPLSLAYEELASRLRRRGVGDLRYYNAQVHDALFALPNFYRDLAGGSPSPTEE